MSQDIIFTCGVLLIATPFWYAYAFIKVDEKTLKENPFGILLAATPLAILFTLSIFWGIRLLVKL